MIQENLLLYKRANARYKRSIKLAKRESVFNLISAITPSTPIGKVWTKIRNFTGYKATHEIHCISSLMGRGKLHTDYKGIGNEFGKYWSANSDDMKFSVYFRLKKRSLIDKPPLI